MEEEGERSANSVMFPEARGQRPVRRPPFSDFHNDFSSLAADLGDLKRLQRINLPRPENNLIKNFGDKMASMPRATLGFV
jgi:hypothetical protein